jgi:hypothetical protein
MVRVALRVASLGMKEAWGVIWATEEKIWSTEVESVMVSSSRIVDGEGKARGGGRLGGELLAASWWRVSRRSLRPPLAIWRMRERMVALGGLAVPLGVARMA